MMRRSQSFRSPAENNSNRTSDLRASSSQMSSLFNRGGKVNNATSMKNDQFLLHGAKKGNAESSTCTTASPQQQKLRVQEIAQSHCTEQRFLSKMRESGVVTSAGYQAVLHDFVASDRKVDQTSAAAAAAADSTQSTNVDRRAEMCKANSSSWRASSRRRSSSRLRGSSLRFSSFFSTCASSYEDEDLAFAIDASENTAASATISDGRTEMTNVNRRSCRRGSSRRFGSFFTAHDNDDFFFDCESTNRVEANIAPLRRSVQLAQEEMEYIENAVSNDYDHPSRQWAMQSSSSITSSLSDSIHSNEEHDGDEGSIQRLEQRIEDVGKNSTLPRHGSLRRCGSNSSPNLNEIFDGIEAAIERSSNTFPPPSKEQTHSSDEAAEAAVVSANTRRNCTESVNFDPFKSKNNVTSKSKEQETFEEQERSTSESSESSCNLDDCGWLPWPERRGSIKEGKDIKSCLDNDYSFLPWPESPKNGRALAA